MIPVRQWGSTKIPAILADATRVLHSLAAWLALGSRSGARRVASRCTAASSSSGKTSCVECEQASLGAKPSALMCDCRSTMLYGGIDK